jgi:Tn3 transposase DDE domain
MGTLYGFKHPSQYDKESLFKPASKANTKLILAEEDNIQHILASLALKVTRHSVMIAKLSSYPRSRITNGRRRDQASEPGKLEACKPLRGLQLTGYRRWGRPPGIGQSLAHIKIGRHQRVANEIGMIPHLARGLLRRTPFQHLKHFPRHVREWLGANPNRANPR